MIDCSKTKNYLSEQARMTKSSDVGVCRISCNHCPLSRFNNGEEMLCTELELTHPEKAIEIVQRWSNAHPQKTYLSELLKIFPNIPLSDDGTPKSLCPFELGVTMTKKCNNECVECWNRIIEDGKE